MALFSNNQTLMRLRARIKDGFGVKTKETAGSEFSATKMEMFIKMLICGFLSCITLGIGFAWFFTSFLKWVYTKTKINGKAITYSGTGGELFVKILIWTLLSIITLGIYGLLRVPRNYCKYFVEHTHFEGESAASEFHGGNIEFLLVLFASGFPFFGLSILLGYVFGNSTISGKKLSFHGDGFAIMAQCLYWGIMGTITLGFFYILGAPFARSAVEFVVENIAVES